ncbi:MAG TPA: hypothetical protein VHY37_13110 [Tepidisphaeraceae bacterium]|jgi:hypothetical protein|nr:hypothetical protein [Tepidisphaeraceae bacterium]
MSPQFAANLATCHRCPHRAAPCAGKCPCAKTGQDIRAHAAAASCPLGLHRRQSRTFPLPGDVIEFLAKLLGLARLARTWENRSGRGCGCAGRKERLNAIARRLFHS